MLPGLMSLCMMPRLQAAGRVRYRDTAFTSIPHTLQLCGACTLGGWYCTPGRVALMTRHQVIRHRHRQAMDQALCLQHYQYAHIGDRYLWQWSRASSSWRVMFLRAGVLMPLLALPLLLLPR